MRLANNLLVRVVGFGVAIIVILFGQHFSNNGATPQRVWTQNTPFIETFADNSNNWPLADNDFVTAKIANQTLSLLVKQQNHSSWELPGVTFPENIDFQVEANLSDGGASVPWDYGIGVRATDQTSDDAYYLYYISQTGGWGLSLYDGSASNHYATIKKGVIPFQFNPKTFNTLRMTAQNHQFTLFLNGTQLTQVNDTQLPINGNPKYILLYVYNGKGIDHTGVTFRNLKITPLVAGAASNK